MSLCSSSNRYCSSRGVVYGRIWEAEGLCESACPGLLCLGLNGISVAWDDTLKAPPVDGIGIPSHSRLILALSPDKVFVEVRVGVELLGEKAGLTLPGFGILFGGGQVEDQVCDDADLRWLVKPGYILLAEAREVDSVDISFKAKVIVIFGPRFVAFIEFPVLALLLFGGSLDSDHLRGRVVILPVGQGSSGDQRPQPKYIRQFRVYRP